MKGKKRNAIQWLYGETNEILVPVMKDKPNECDEIAVGDPVFVSVSTKTNPTNRFKAFPIGSLATASVGDANAFYAGISMSQSQDGDDQAIRVATTGIFEIPLNTATTVKPGYFAKYVTGAGTGSVDVDAVSAAAPTGTYVHAMGTIVEAGTTVSVAKVKIQSRLLGLASLDTTRAV